MSQDFHRTPLPAGTPIRYWQLGALREARYDVADAPMQGEMDPFFFLTKHKNFIPHEYPCRTQFAAERRDRRPQVEGRFEAVSWWLPFGSPRLDLSGFWFRPTIVGNWARTMIEAEAPGDGVLRLGTCGGAVIFLNGAEIGWLAAYSRNLEVKAEFTLPLNEGLNELVVFFDDLAERDARFFIEAEYVTGPAAQLALPVPVAAGVAATLEEALEGMHFERSAYFGEDVTLLFPRPLPEAVRALVRVEGDFMSTERFAFEFTLPRGATRLELGSSEALPADFRHFRITLESGGLVLSRSIGIEICHARRQGEAPATLAARISETLEEISAHSERDTVRALARLATGRGGADTDAMIEAELPAIEDCHDCADFILVPLIWSRSVWGEAIGETTRARIDAAILNYRYWMDEPGNDVQWYFSENHALLFHTAAYLGGQLFPEARFRRSGRTGREQSAVGRERVRAWLDHFEHWEMAEFNSAPYFPIDLKGLTALAALAPDADIRTRATAGIVRLVEIVARSAHHGMLTAAQGRSYEHTLAAGRSLELSGIARLLWGKGNYGRRVHALPQLAVLLRDHGLEIPAEFAEIADWRGEDAQEWCFAQGQGRIAKLYHYKSRAVAMGSIAHYRWGEWGYQETLLHLRLGSHAEAAVWINHPGEVIQFGYGRPSYWGGSGTVPRTQQYRGLAVLDFDIHPEQPDFTHAWFPAQAFAESRVRGPLALARQGEGLVLLKGHAAFEPIATGPAAGCELRLAGRRARWIVRVTDTGETADLDALADRFGGLTVVEAEDGGLSVFDPEYGHVLFHGDGRVTAEDRTLDPAQWTVQGRAERLTPTRSRHETSD
jgi:hypothetical protein